MEEFLQDLYQVGPSKPLGYLPLTTIQVSGVSVDQLIAWAQSQNLKHKLLSEKQCDIAGGALYIWSSQSVQKLLDDNLSILKQSNWPIHDDAFVHKVANHLAKQPSLYELVGVMFSDERMEHPQWVKVSPNQPVKVKRQP